jgi:spore maturation protein B
VNILELLLIISQWCIPFIILFILSYGIFKRIKVYETFVDGAADGIEIVVKIIPYLTAMVVAINIFRVSGALDIILSFFSPVLQSLDIPSPVAPLLFLRPLSGSASLAYISDIFSEFGPDTYIGKLASTIQGSTETTFYIIAVYFGAVGIKKYRYAMVVGLIADLAGFFAAVFICKYLFY